MIHRVAAALGLAALFPASMRAQALAVSPPSVAELKLSLDDFAALALKQSLRYQTYR
ncbi:MAG: hypothetical protein HYZ74_04295, partial [Elusimicrobia bacterium]|nr:hypothetical protein [Elusimicrobiota bacterium]